jgi:hypothetical protein
MGAWKWEGDGERDWMEDEMRDGDASEKREMSCRS